MTWAIWEQDEGGVNSMLSWFGVLHAARGSVTDVNFCTFAMK